MNSKKRNSKDGSRNGDSQCLAADATPSKFYKYMEPEKKYTGLEHICRYEGKWNSSRTKQPGEKEQSENIYAYGGNADPHNRRVLLCCLKESRECHHDGMSEKSKCIIPEHR